MAKQNLVGVCLAEVRKVARTDPSRAATHGWELTRQMLAEILNLPIPERRELIGSLNRERQGSCLALRLAAQLTQCEKDLHSTCAMDLPH